MSEVPPGYVRWAAMGVGVLLLSVAIAVVVGALGLFGFTSSAEDAGKRVPARVAAGAPCAKAGATETVTFTLRGKERTASFDGCGHAKGEPVDIVVPAGAAPAGKLVVHSAGAAVGDKAPGEELGLVLLVGSGLGGACYAFLVRRGSRSGRLPAPLRLVA